MRTLCLLVLLALFTGCRKEPPGEGFKQLTWTLEPAPGSPLPKSRGVLRLDGTGTLDTGSGPEAITIGPMAMTGIEKALDQARPHANGVFTNAGDRARVEVTPARGAAWKLEQQGDAGPEPVKRLFFVLLHAFRPKR